MHRNTDSRYSESYLCRPPGINDAPVSVGIGDEREVQVREELLGQETRIHLQGPVSRKQESRHIESPRIRYREHAQSQEQQTANRRFPQNYRDCAPTR